MTAGTGDHRPGLKGRLLVLGLLLGAAVAPYAAALLRGEVPYFLDIRDHWFPLRRFAHEAWTQGVLAHWCRGLFCGTPFLAQSEAALLYPPHLLTDLFDPAATLLPQLVGHRLVAGMLTYLLLREVGVGRFAGGLGGALFVLCGFTNLQTQQPAHLRALAWLPGMWLGAQLIAGGRRRSGVLVLSSCGALAILAGYPAFVLRSGLMSGLILFLGASGEGRRFSVKELLARLGAGATAAVLAGLLCAPQLVATAHMASVSQRALGLDRGFADAFAAAPADLAMIVLPRFHVDGGVARAGFGYVGMAALLLAFVACLRHSRRLAPYGCAAALGLLLSLGSATPVGAFLQGLPGFSYIRNPSQHLLTFDLATAVLAGVGVQEWVTKRPAGPEMGALGVLLLVLMTAGLLGPPPLGGLPEIARAAVAFAGGLTVVLTGICRPSRIQPVILGAALLIDAGSFGLGYATARGRTSRPSEMGRPSAALSAALRDWRQMSGGLPGRLVDSDAVFNGSNLHLGSGLESVRGLLSLVPQRSIDVSRVVAEGTVFPRVAPSEPLYDYGPGRNLASPLLDLLAVRYAVGYETCPGPEWKPVGNGAWKRDSADVMRVSRVSRLVDPGGDAVRPFVEGDIHGRAVVLEADASNLPAGLDSREPGEGSVLEASFGVNTARIGVTSEGGEVLFWAETHDVGWKAWVDGEPTTIYRANHAFMAVPIPAGKSTVTWRYLTPGWPGGILLAGAGLALWLAIAFGSRLRFVVGRR